MKFRNYLETIDGIAIYPMISLLIFFPFFVGLIWYVFRLDKRIVKKVSDMPLEDGTIQRAVKIFLGLFLLSTIANAQAPVATEPPPGNQELIMGVIIGLLILVVLAMVILLIQIYTLLQKVNRPQYSAETEQTDLRGDKAPIFSERWWQRWTGFGVRMQDEQSILIKGHDYDGIHELDNRMPPWLAFLFQATIVFSIVYGIYYHWSKLGDLPAEELAKETKVIEAQKSAFLEKAAAKINENSVTLLTDAASIDAGKQIFSTNCAACHAPDGGGTVGPNLTDVYWIHGGGIKNIFKTIKYGVPQKGMISWEAQLNPLKMQQVASYIVSLKGTKPATPKAPQGDIYNEGATVAPAAASADSVVATK